MKVLIILLGLAVSLSQTVFAFGDTTAPSSELTHIKTDMNQLGDELFVDMTNEYWSFQNEHVEVRFDNLSFAEIADGGTCKVTMKRIRILWSLICIGEIVIEVPCEDPIQ